ncbi:TPA: peptidase [Bacillus cereus]|nr:peptidase [Bacillus cereus]
MKLIDIQHNYDAVFSLGDRCLVSDRLLHYNLRTYTGIIDWMLSPNLLQVISLLQNRLRGFMNKEQMIWDGYDTFGHCLLLKDIIYNITSVHDFFINENTITDWNTYPTFKIKLNRRIERFLSKLETCHNILFIRIGGTYKEAKLLEAVLSEMVQGEFRVLLINEIAEYKLVEYDWDLPYTCSIGMPLTKDEQLWDSVLKGITYSDKQ